MNSFLDKVRDVLTALIGKVLLGVFIFSFVITFLLALTQGNNILLSISKSIISSCIITLIAYILYFIITKVLADIINEVSAENNGEGFDIENSSIADFNESSLNDNKQEEKEIKGDEPLEIVEGSILDNNKRADEITKENNEKDDIVIPKVDDIVDKVNDNKKSGIDKKDKLSYDNKKGAGSSFDVGFVDFSPNSDDISSIVFSDKVKDAPSTKTDSGAKSNSNDGFIDFSKAAKSNPETMAKAIRSMRSRDGDDK